MKLPENLKYQKSHEWVKDNNDGTFSIGITDFAQNQLGDMVYIQLPEVGKKYQAGDECGIVESVKSAADVYAPIFGEVISINNDVVNSPELINQDPYANWLWQIKAADPKDFQKLLDFQEYQQHLDDEN